MAGHVDRAVLQSYYQSSGQIYDDTKTEGAFETVAQAVDANYDFVQDLLGTGEVLRPNTPINIMYPPPPLAAVLADGTDILGDTTRLQAIIDYGIANERDVYIPKDLILQPITQSDGTLVCIKFDDGNAATGNDRTPIKIFSKKGATITTNNTTSAHTIFRWKLGDSILDGFRFVGTRAYTTALEISRIKLNDITEADASTRNRFSNLRFYNCNKGITMEGSAYYNTFDNISFYANNLMLWLKPTYALINALLSDDSGVNRNNFYSLSAYACTDGIKLDFGDTNKFYSSSFEGLSGTAITVNDQVATYPAVQQTIYNTFYGVTNEANTLNLLYNAPYGNSFIDFESAYTKVTFNYQPLVYIPSGDISNGHLIMQRAVQTNDQDVLAYSKNRSFDTSIFGMYVNDVADYTQTLDANGRYKVYNWRNYNFLATDCENVASRVFNSSGTKQAVYKSVGGIVYYMAKLSFIPANAALQIKIPLPPLAVDAAIYGFGVNIQGCVSIGYRKDGGTPQIIPAIIDGLNLTIPVPTTGNWSTTAGNSANVLMINLHYARTLPAFRDLN